jgi:hypothetical protein
MTKEEEALLAAYVLAKSVELFCRWGDDQMRQDMIEKLARYYDAENARRA